MFLHAIVVFMLLLAAPVAALGQTEPEPGQTGQSDQAVSAEVTETEAAPSLARRIAESTRTTAESLVQQANRIRAEMTQTSGAGTEIDWPAVASAALLLAIIAAAAYLTLWALRLGLRMPRAALNRWVTGKGGGARIGRQVGGLIAGALLEAAALLVAFVVGYTVALLWIGESGAMATRHSLFLNAFLIVEAGKALSRLLFSTRNDGLRIVPLGPETATWINAWLARLIELTGYGLLVVVPIANVSLSPAIGNLVRVLVTFLAFVVAALLILSRRKVASAALNARAQTISQGTIRTLVAMLARTWHWLALAYLFAGFGVALTSPETALPFMAAATAKSLLVAGLAVFLSVLLGQLGRLLTRGGSGMASRLPSFDARLKKVIPRGLFTVRALIFIVAVAVILDTWQVSNIQTWFASDAGVRLTGTALSVLFIVAIASAVWIGAASWIEYRLHPDIGTGEPAARAKTLLVLFKNGIAIVIVIITAMIVLSEIGINIGPLIAGAGVLGLAVGFGAQKLVQDVITGVFIQLEDAIHTGDVISVAGITGGVERVTIRSVGIRDLSGTLHIIPFSSVDTVSNFMRDFSYHLGVYGVAYREDTDAVIEHLRAAFEELRNDPAQSGKILGDLEVHGITEFGDNAVNIRVRIKTAPGAQWPVGRAYNRLVKQHFDAAGIEIPFPHTTLYFGEDKDGRAPAANVRMLPPGLEPGGETA